MRSVAGCQFASKPADVGEDEILAIQDFRRICVEDSNGHASVILPACKRVLDIECSNEARAGHESIPVKRCGEFSIDTHLGHRYGYVNYSMKSRVTHQFPMFNEERRHEFQ